MESANILRLGIFALAFGLSGCERQISFSGDVQPILADNCVECHDKSAEGAATSGLDLTNYEAIMKGTKFGPAVVAGSSASSALYLVIAQKTDPKIQMPPHHEDAWAKGRGYPLSDKQVDSIRAWIDQGALDN